MINTDTSSLPLPSAPRLSLRVKESNRRHHLWNNNGTWWIHYTLHFADYTARRIRHSLKTNEEAEAIQLRDNILSSQAAIARVA